MMMVTAAVVPILLLMAGGAGARPPPRRILVDTDVDTDDIFAILYLLKQDRSEFDLKVRKR